MKSIFGYVFFSRYKGIPYTEKGTFKGEYIDPLKDSFNDWICGNGYC